MPSGEANDEPSVRGQHRLATELIDLCVRRYRRSRGVCLGVFLVSSMLTACTSVPHDKSFDTYLADLGVGGMVGSGGFNFIDAQCTQCAR